jgi:CheY-like chemotaxis protein
MTALIVVLMFVGFVVLDLLVRAIVRRSAARREMRQREAVLKTAVRLDFTHEARSLNRVEVKNPKARILAVDDEPVVLDSIRKILVMDGYSVDTVESGPEALGLVQRHEYDLVFTDLKMHGMDGVEVVKAIHHLRPDLDLAVITGYATIESAVETMQHGAADYVQKPFTEEELVKFARTLLIKRQARLDAQRRPVVRLVTPSMAEATAARDYSVPGGAFLSDGHTWARIESGGQVRVGLDDFARKALGSIERIELPQEGASVRRGESLFTVKRGTQSAHFMAPLGGRVARINPFLTNDPSLVGRSPYDKGWVCLVDPSDLAGELSSLRIGAPLVEWYQQEIARLQQAGGPADDGAPAVDWGTIEERFLRVSKPVRA